MLGCGGDVLEMEVLEEDLEVAGVGEELEVEGPFFSFTVKHLYNLSVWKSSKEKLGSLPSS